MFDALTPSARLPLCAPTPHELVPTPPLCRGRAPCCHTERGGAARRRLTSHTPCQCHTHERTAPPPPPPAAPRPPLERATRCARPVAGAHRNAARTHAPAAVPPRPCPRGRAPAARAVRQEAAAPAGAGPRRSRRRSSQLRLGAPPAPPAPPARPPRASACPPARLSRAAASRARRT